ncbi:6-bladed beta-propeller, partial [Parabacteroides goldsteinii]
MKKLTYILLAGILFSCSGETKQTAAEEKTIDNIIRLGDAINQIREVNLSELVDSITYLPLETRKECLLRNTSWFNYSPPYIICSRTVFD